MFQNHKVLVAGGTGFIGTNLIKGLLKRGARVRATFHKRKPTEFLSQVNYLGADLTRREDCRMAVSDCDYVFMCSAYALGAGMPEEEKYRHMLDDLVMTSSMLEVAHKARVKKIMWLSSCVIYPISELPLKEEQGHEEKPFHKYLELGMMKRCGEILCQSHSENIGNSTKVIVVRPTSAYGPHENMATGHVIPALIQRVIQRQDPIEVWGDGTAQKDLIFIDDLVEGMLMAMERVNKFMPINLGSGKQTSIREIVETIIKVDGHADARVVFDPSKPTTIPKMPIDVGKAEEVLGFKAKTTLEDGLKKTISWYRQNAR